MTIDRSAAYTFGGYALGMRLFFALAIDHPSVYHTGWIVALLSCLLLLPFCLCMDAMERRFAPDAPLIGLIKRVGAVPVRIWAFLLAAFLLLESASALHMLTGSASYVALSSVPPFWITASCAIVAMIGMLFGVRAVSAAGRVLCAVANALLLVVLILQFDLYTPRWLTPILGNGVPSLLETAPPVAGMLTGIIALWLMAEPGKGFWRSMTAVLGAVGLAVAVLSAVCAMLSPAMPGAPSTRVFQLERVLSNGRNPISMQFLTVLIWYFGLIVMLAFSTQAAARMLAVALPVFETWRGALAVTGVTLALYAIPRLNEARIDLWNLIRLPVCAIPIPIFLLLAMRRKKT